MYKSACLHTLLHIHICVHTTLHLYISNRTPPAAAAPDDLTAALTGGS